MFFSVSFDKKGSQRDKVLYHFLSIKYFFTTFAKLFYKNQKKYNFKPPF